MNQANYILYQDKSISSLAKYIFKLRKEFCTSIMIQNTLFHITGTGFYIATAIMPSVNIHISFDFTLDCCV